MTPPTPYVLDNLDDGNDGTWMDECPYCGEECADWAGCGSELDEPERGSG